MSPASGSRRQPRVKRNDWTALQVPALGEWAPTLSVTVVIPAHDPVHLPKVLAGLAVQSYPGHLLEVVVVDDGSSPPVTLPEIRPENTRLLTTGRGWGRAAACQHGADHSDGQVLHWLDADMVPHRQEVEAQLRWHHQVDYAVTLAEKTFAGQDALDHLSPAELRDRLATGVDPRDLAHGEISPHGWVDEIVEATERLSSAGPRAMRVHTGASAAVGRDLFRDAGGMPVDLVLGEDIVLGYRLREAGAVFIPDIEARCTHLGETTVMRRARALNRYNRPFIADKVPEFRGHRTAVSRSYEVPYVEVVVPVGDAGYEQVRATVDHLLGGRLPDLVVTLVADWSVLIGGRRDILGDDHLDLRLIAASYSSEPRVRCVEAPRGRSEATFRLSLPGDAWVPVGPALERLVLDADSRHLDAVAVELPGSPAARLVRTSYASRAARTGGSLEIDETRAGVAAGFVAVDEAPKPKRARGLSPWRDPGRTD